MSVLLQVISRKENCRLKLNVLPAKQIGLTTVDSIKKTFLKKTIRGNFAAKIVKTSRGEAEKQTRSSRRVVRR